MLSVSMRTKLVLLLVLFNYVARNLKMNVVDQDQAVQWLYLAIRLRLDSFVSWNLLELIPKTQHPNFCNGESWLQNCPTISKIRIDCKSLLTDL